MFQTLFLIAAALVTGLAFADEMPDVPRHQLLFPTQSEIDRSIIYVTCDYPTSSVSTDCEVLQVFFTKPKVDDITDDSLNGVEAAIDEVCTVVRESSPDISWNDSDIQAKLEGKTPAEIDQIKGFFQVCVEKGRDSRRALLRSLVEDFQDEQRKRCNPIFLPDQSRSFTWHDATNQWRSVTDTDGSCGSVNVATLRSDDGTWWTYTSQTIISNPEAKEATTDTSCEEWGDASVLVWRSRGNAIRMNCQIIGNSWNK